MLNIRTKEMNADTDQVDKDATCDEGCAAFGEELDFLSTDEAMLDQAESFELPSRPLAAAAEADRQDSWESTDFISVDPVSSILLSETPASPGASDIDQTSEAPKKKKTRRGGKRRVSVEEKDAKVRARNRRAQQAFRQRQKALAVERSTSLSRLEAELACLQDANRDLQQALQQARAELAKERAINDNIANMAKQQDLQMMNMFGDIPQLAPSFPAAPPPCDSRFSDCWVPTLDIDAPIQFSAGLPLHH